jgi:hypothetical protein
VLRIMKTEPAAILQQLSEGTFREDDRANSAQMYNETPVWPTF